MFLFPKSYEKNKKSFKRYVLIKTSQNISILLVLKMGFIPFGAKSRQEHLTPFSFCSEKYKLETKL